MYSEEPVCFVEGYGEQLEAKLKCTEFWGGGSNGNSERPWHVAKASELPKKRTPESAADVSAEVMDLKQEGSACST